MYTRDMEPQSLKPDWDLISPDTLLTVTFYSIMLDFPPNNFPDTPGSFITLLFLHNFLSLTFTLYLRFSSIIITCKALSKSDHHFEIFHTLRCMQNSLQLSPILSPNIYLSTSLRLQDPKPSEARGHAFSYVFSKNLLL